MKMQLWIGLICMTVFATGCGKNTLYTEQADINVKDAIGAELSAYQDKLNQAYTLASDDDRLYITDYVANLKDNYDKALEYRDQIAAEKAKDGVSFWDDVEEGSESSSSLPETSVTEETDTNDIPEYDEELEEEWNDLLNSFPDLDNSTRESVTEDLSSYTSKEDLLEYYAYRVHLPNVGGYGDEEPTEEFLENLALDAAGTEENPDGISREVWDAMSFEEAREYCINSILYDAYLYNDSLLKERDYYSSEKFKEYLYQDKYDHDSIVKKANDAAGIVDYDLEDRLSKSGVRDTNRVAEIAKEAIESIPDKIEIDSDVLTANIEGIETKTDLLEYIANNYRGYQGDFGDSEMSLSQIGLLALTQISTTDFPNGVTEEIWDAMTLDEAKRCAYDTIVYGINKYNAKIDSDIAYYTSEEYIDSLTKSQEEYERQQWDIVTSSKEDGTIYNGPDEEVDLDSFIHRVDMDNPAFSESIEKDENGEYYIPWKVLYDLADTQNNGVMMDNLKFIAYGQEITIPMPEVPLSFYGNKGEKAEIKEWKIITTTTGRQRVEVTFDLPEAKEDVVFNFDIDSETGKLKDSFEFDNFVTNRSRAN